MCNLSDVIEKIESDKNVEITTLNMLDMYSEFIKNNHAKEYFEIFAYKWVE